MEQTTLLPKTNKPVHRVGTITFGCTLIIFGVLFLLHMIVPSFGYEFIFRLWPCILIFLGIEILVGHYKEGSTFVYDKASIFLLVVLSFFSLVMASIDYLVQNFPQAFYIY